MDEGCPDLLTVSTTLAARESTSIAQHSIVWLEEEAKEGGGDPGIEGSAA